LSDKPVALASPHGGGDLVIDGISGHRSTFLILRMARLSPKVQLVALVGSG